MFHLSFFFSCGSKQLSFSFLKRSLYGFWHAGELLVDVQRKVPRAAQAGTQTHVYTNTTDRNGWTGGQTGSRVAHVLRAPRVRRGACMTVLACSASTVRECPRCRCPRTAANAGAHLPTLPAAWAHSPQGMGWGGEGG